MQQKSIQNRFIFFHKLKYNEKKYNNIHFYSLLKLGYDVMKYIDYKETRKQGTFNFPIALYHLTPQSPRYYMPYHWHTHYEIIRIISGSFQLTLDSKTQTYCEGDIIFVTDKRKEVQIFCGPAAVNGQKTENATFWEGSVSMIPISQKTCLSDLWARKSR